MALKYVVPVSGGKDSQVVLSMAVKTHGAENVIGVHHYTGIDNRVTYEHMRWMENFYGVPIEFTKNSRFKDMWDLMEKRNTMPSRLARFCTQELKIRSFNQWLDQREDLAELIVLMGMRQAESRDRAARYSDISPDDIFSLCDLNPGNIPSRFAAVRVQLPIVHRSTSWVFEYLRAEGAKINPLYARGHKRVGCYPCLLAGTTDFRLAARDPEGRETITKLRDFRVVMAVTKGYALEQIMPMDLDAILEEGDADPFGLWTPSEDEAEDTAGGCQFCSI